MDSEEQKIILHENMDKILKYVFPILIYDKSELFAENWLSGGTGFFLKIGKYKLLMTAYHVIKYFTDSQLRSPTLLFIGSADSIPQDISDWEVVSYEANLDLCSMLVPDSFDPTSMGKVFYTPPQWPQRRTIIGDSAFILGFPAEQRKAEDSNALFFMHSAIYSFVTSVSDLRFIIADENNEREVLYQHPYVSNLINFGGMSGSPVFVHDKTGNTVLGGVLTDRPAFIDGIHAPFSCVHIDFLNLSGRIYNTF